MKCFVWSAALHGLETWTLRRNEQKRLKAFQTRICKMDRQHKNAVVLERVGKNNAGTDKEEEKKLAGPFAKKELLLKDALEGMANGKKFRGRKKYQMLDNIMINGLYEDTKRKAEKRVERRRLSLQ